MKEFIATFSVGIDSPFRNGFVRVMANNAREAALKMNGHFGEHWACVYNSEGEAGVKRFNLREVSWERKEWLALPKT